MKQAAKFCRCIKAVRKTLKARKGSTKEQGAIAVCVKSVLHTRGKTIKRFKCGKKPKLVTQKRKKVGGSQTIEHELDAYFDKIGKTRAELMRQADELRELTWGYENYPEEFAAYKKMVETAPDMDDIWPLQRELRRLLDGVLIAHRKRYNANFRDYPAWQPQAHV